MKSPLPRALALAILVTLPAWSRWAPIPGTQSLYIKSILSWDGVLYVGTQSDGAYLLSPPSDTLVPAPLRARVNVFVGSGPTVYAGTDSGVYRTQDKGAHWNHLPNPPNDETILSLAVQGDTLYAGTFLGLAASWNGGASWTRVGGDLIQSWVEGVGASGDRVFAGSGDDFIGHSFHRSDDAGKTWKSAGGGVGGRVSGVLFLGNRLFAASTEGLRISNDRGDTWGATPEQAMVANAADFFASKLDFSGGGLFFSHFGDNDFASFDSGATWRSVKNPPLGSASYAAAAGRIYVGTQAGLFFAAVDSGLAVRSVPRRDAVPARSRFSVGSEGVEFRSEGADRPFRADGRLIPVGK